RAMADRLLKVRRRQVFSAMPPEGIVQVLPSPRLTLQCRRFLVPVLVLCGGSEHPSFSREVVLSQVREPAVLRSIDREHVANNFPIAEGGRHEFAKVDGGQPLPASPKSPYRPRQQIFVVGRGFQSSDLCRR